MAPTCLSHQRKQPSRLGCTPRLRDTVVAVPTPPSASATDAAAATDRLATSPLCHTSPLCNHQSVSCELTLVTLAVAHHVCAYA
jgi:hypothetical protein